MASNKRSKSKNGEASGISEKTNGGNSDKDALIEEHLPPMALVAAVMICSGPLFVFYMRDFLATGKVIAGRWDEDLMVSCSPKDIVLCNLYNSNIIHRFSRNQWIGSMMPKAGSLSKVDSVQ